jgi:hypothetical protein
MHSFMKARRSITLVPNFLARASFLQADVFIALALLAPVAVPAGLGEANAHTSINAIKILAVDFMGPLPLPRHGINQSRSADFVQEILDSGAGVRGVAVLDA